VIPAAKVDAVGKNIEALWESKMIFHTVHGGKVLLSL